MNKIPIATGNDKELKTLTAWDYRLYIVNRIDMIKLRPSTANKAELRFLRRVLEDVEEFTSHKWALKYDY